MSPFLRAHDRVGISPRREAQHAQGLSLERVDRAPREPGDADRLLDTGDVECGPRPGNRLGQRSKTQVVTAGAGRFLERSQDFSGAYADRNERLEESYRSVPSAQRSEFLRLPGARVRARLRFRGPGVPRGTGLRTGAPSRARIPAGTQPDRGTIVRGRAGS